MSEQELLEQLTSLPVEGQRQVEEFIAVLRRRYETRENLLPSQAEQLGEEPFIGMWSGREDMKDGTAWVRRTRGSEWQGERIDS